jgi:hypothetical protein
MSKIVNICDVNESQKVSSVRLTRAYLIVWLIDGRIIREPLARHPMLARATPDQRRRWELCGADTGIRWPLLDYDLSVAGLLRGEPGKLNPSKTMSIESPNVELRKMERQCPHNTEVNQGKRNEKLIYDFEVLIDGDHRATWCHDWGHRSYKLMTPDHKDRITENDEYRSWVEAKDQGELLKLVHVCLQNGRIPTLAQYAQAKRDAEKAEADKKAAELEEKRRQQVCDAGPELLSALQQLLADYKATIRDLRAKDGKLAPRNWDEYPLTKTAQNAIDLATKPDVEPCVVCTRLTSDRDATTKEHVCADCWRTGKYAAYLKEHGRDK